MTMLDSLKQEYEGLESILQVVERRITTAPKGKIRLTSSHGCRQYYWAPKSDGGYQYLSAEKDKKTIVALIQKRYDIKIRNIAQKEQFQLKRLLAIYGEGDTGKEAIDSRQPALPRVATIHGARDLRLGESPRFELIKAVYEKLSPERKQMVRPCVWPDGEYAKRWLLSLPADDALLPDGCVYATDQGEKVRSKSEVIIANKLFAAGVPYQYERPLELGSRKTHPDFLVLNPATRQEWIWEHFGKMDDPDYLQSALQKLKLYAQYGITPGHGLIATFESSKNPLDIVAVDSIVASLVAH